MADYIVQKAVELDKVKKKLQRPLSWYRENYYMQHKYDGCHAVVKLYPGGSFDILSRTGEVVRSLDHIGKRLARDYQYKVEAWGGMVLLGEAWAFGIPFNEISGMFRRQSETAHKLWVVIFDCLTLDEFEAGYSPVGWRDRFDRIGGFDSFDTATTFAPGKYGDPQLECNAMVDAGGYDGIILRDPNGTWTKGRGTTGEIIKVKKSLSFDLRVVAVEMGKGKHEGRTGALAIDFGGKLLRVGTGFTDAQRDQWAANANDIVGKIVEVEAMDYSSDGLLREPRFKGVRHDKIEPDTIAA